MYEKDTDTAQTPYILKRLLLRPKNDWVNKQVIGNETQHAS